MTAAFDGEGVTVVDLRPHVVPLSCKIRERACDIEGGKGFGALLDVGALRYHGRDQSLKNFQLKPECALGGAGDFCFELRELGGGETDLSGQCLPVNEYAVEGRAHQALAVLRGHFDEIAEYIIVFDLEYANAGVLGIARLQGCYHASRFITER